MKPEFLLSEEFVAFSTAVAGLHAQRKELDTEFKKLYAEHKAKMKAIDEEAVQLQQNFDNWVASQGK